MRVLGRHWDKNGEGYVVMIPEQTEDMWHCFNLIGVGDRLKSTTVRKVQTESATGSRDSSRVRTTITVNVENIEFDEYTGLLRIKGRNVVENKFIKLGAYHTLDLELNQKFTLEKACWDIIAIDRVEKASNPIHTAEVAAVVMEEGLANICLITDNMTLVRQRIEPTIPRKRRGDVSQYEKGMQKFFDQVMAGLQNANNVNFGVIKCLILASPGFVKDQCYEYIFAEAVKKDLKIFQENKGKFLLVHSSSGHVHALNEVLKEPTVLAKLSDTKALAEVKALDVFFNMMNEDPLRAYYGYKHVRQAANRQAVDTLLISDGLFRSRNVSARRRYVALVESVQHGGGKVHIFSSAHVSGEQLEQLSGIAALLRFPMEEDEEDEEEDDEINQLEKNLEEEREKRERHRHDVEREYEQKKKMQEEMEDGLIIDDDTDQFSEPPSTSKAAPAQAPSSKSTTPAKQTSTQTGSKPAASTSSPAPTASTSKPAAAAAAAGGNKPAQGNNKAASSPAPSAKPTQQQPAGAAQGAKKTPASPAQAKPATAAQPAKGGKGPAQPAGKAKSKAKSAHDDDDDDGYDDRYGHYDNY